MRHPSALSMVYIPFQVSFQENDCTGDNNQNRQMKYNRHRELKKQTQITVSRHTKKTENMLKNAAFRHLSQHPARKWECI